MPSRRRALAATGAVVAGGMAGCLDFILGDDSLSYEATAASVDDAALDETGYEEASVEDNTFEETFEAGGESRDVEVTNWQAEYDKGIDFGGLSVTGGDRARAAVFTILTSPQVEVLGRDFNPIADMDSDDIAAMFQDRFDGASGLEPTGSETLTLLGEQTESTRYQGDVEVLALGAEVEMVFHITETVTSGDDHALVIAGYPVELEDQERPNFDRLREGVRHDG